jgi:hypothetical protein
MKLGALALGGRCGRRLGLGAVAVARRAIGRAAIKRLEIAELEVGRLTVGTLEVRERSRSSLGAEVE